MKKSIFFAITLFAIGVEPAFAYINLGSGSTIMSVIIGFCVAIGVLVKTFWYKIKGFLELSKNKKTDSIPTVLEAAARRPGRETDGRR